ncbi:MAG: SGNH/GDSL hydrolase family protein [Planctomycetota bacterium]
MKPKVQWYALRMRTVLLCVVLIAAAFSYVGWRYYNALRVRTMGTGPAGPPVAAAPFERVWNEQDVVFLGVGDSITRGYGAPGGLTYFNLLKQNNNARYPDMRGRDLSSVFPKLTARNVAVDYTISQEHIDFQLVKIPRYGPDVRGVIVLTSGGNDLIHDYGRSEPRHDAMYGCSYKQGKQWCEMLKGRLDTLLTGLMEKFPGGCDIFFANIYDPTDGVGDPQTVMMNRWGDCVKVLGLANEKIAELCEKYPNVHRVDIHTPFLGHGIHCDEPWRKHYHKDDPHFWYAPILEDPNIRGHDAIRRVFLDEMIQVYAQ